MKNQLKIGVILSYLATVFQFAVQLLYTPVMIRILGQGEYGLYTLVASLMGYFSLFSLGVTGSYLRFYSRYAARGDREGEARLNGLLLMVYFVMSALTILCGLVLTRYPRQVFGPLLTQAELDKARILLIILVVNIALTFPASLFDSIISAHEQFLFQRTLRILKILANPLLALPLLLMGYGSVAMVSVTTLITCLHLLASVIYCFRRLHTRFRFKHIHFSLLKEIYGFSFFIFINMIIDQFNWNVDKLILGHICGTIAIAIYGVAAQINTCFLTLTNVISSVYAPRVNRLAAAEMDHSDSLLHIFCKVGRIQYILALYIFIGFVFCGRTFLRLWMGPDYGASYYVALLLLAPLPIVLGHSMGIEIRRAKNVHRLASLIMLGTAVLNVIVSIPLTRFFGPVGSAFGTFVSLILNMIFMDIYYVRVVGLDVRELYKCLGQITWAILPAIIFGLVGLWTVNPLINVAWAVVYSVILAVCLYRKVLDDREKEMIGKVLRKLHLCRNVREEGK